MGLTIQLELPLYTPIQMVMPCVKAVKRVAKSIPNIPKVLQLTLPLEVVMEKASFWGRVKKIGKKIMKKIKKYFTEK